MEPIFTLCHADEWTPEKVIFYVKNLKDVAESDYITTDMKHGTEYSVHGVTKLEGPCTPVDLYGATHKVTAVRANAPKHFGDVPPAGSIFYCISRAAGEFTTQDDVRSLRSVLNVHTLREIIAGLLQIEHGQHFVIKCTDEQRKQLAKSIIEDAKSAGLEMSEDFNSRKHFEFIQWWTGLTVTFEVDDYFLVRQVKVREHSIITRDLNHTDESTVTRIDEKGHVYVRSLTQNTKADPYQGAEHKWDGAFLVANY